MSTHGRFGWMSGVAVAALILGTLAVGVTDAQQQRRTAAGRMWQRGGMMDVGPMAGFGLPLRQLGLTDQQREQVRSIMAGHKGDLQALSERAVPARRALMDAIAGGDEATIRQKSADVASVQTDRALLAARIRTEVFKILTPEQQQKAQSLRQRVEERMNQRRARRAGEW